MELIIFNFCLVLFILVLTLYFPYVLLSMIHLSKRRPGVNSWTYENMEKVCPYNTTSTYLGGKIFLKVINVILSSIFAFFCCSDIVSVQFHIQSWVVRPEVYSRPYWETGKSNPHNPTHTMKRGEIFL